MWKRIILGVLIWLMLLALPFLLRQRESNQKIKVKDSCDHLVIISAHNKALRDEYVMAFSRYYKEKFGKNVELDFRAIGGTSDIVRYLNDRYSTEFRLAWEKHGNRWTQEIASGFQNSAVDNKSAKFSQEVRAAREFFMNSNIGIGIDVFAGGGTFEQAKQAEKGFAVDAKVKDRHPEYFSLNRIPASFGGDLLYDPQGRYYSVVVSTFGIIYNTERIKELNGILPPTSWYDLSHPIYFNKLAVADPSKSGSANKCFEIMLQQVMSEYGSPESGWEPGLLLIKKIFANARVLTDSASKVVREVGCGDAVAGTAIDSYGISESQWSAHLFNGKSHCCYVAPRGGTAVSGDPVQLLRGAENVLVAQRFIDFLLSEEGQKLHCYKIGAPNGPIKHALNRPPVRKDIYDKDYAKYSFAPEYNPYRSGADFKYNPRWTARYYNLLRILIKAIMLDVQPELRLAWHEIIKAGGAKKVPMAMQEFSKLPFDYNHAGEAAGLLKIANDRDAVAISATIRSWSDFARRHYNLAAELARQGR